MDSTTETEPPPPPSPPPSPPPPPLSTNISAPLPLLQLPISSPNFKTSPPLVAATTFTITTTIPPIPQSTTATRPIQPDSVPLIFLPMPPPPPSQLPTLAPPSSLAQSAPSSTTITTIPTTSQSETSPVLPIQPCESQDGREDKQSKKSVFFSTVTVYYFTRSQGFISIPTQGGSTLGMKRRHFLRRKLSVDMHEEVRKRSRRQIILKIRFDKDRRKNNNCKQGHYNSTSSSTSSTSSTSNTTTSDSDDDDEGGESSYSDSSDISDSELESRHVTKIFVQPMDVKLRRSLLRASGVGRIDPKEKKECKVIRESRDRSGCKCVNQCLPGICECISLGVNCHVDRDSFPCGCVSTGCQNPQGRTEFDYKRVRGHLFEKLMKSGIG